MLAGAAHRLGGNPRSLVVPLRSGLPRGSYTVRWSVVSDDGHLIRGVLAFAVGAGSPRPVPTLSAGGGLSAASVVLRLLFLAGVMLAGGAVLAGRLLLERSRWRLEAGVVFVGLALVAAGGFGLLAHEPAVDSTRFGRVTEAAAIAAVVGMAVALASIRVRPLARGVVVIGLLELVSPTLGGHALDPHRVRWLVALADLVHVAAAAFWIGGILLLLLSRSARARRRFPPFALSAVVLLGAAAIPRAVAALPSVGDLVHTGYGRALIVKTAVLAAALGIAWVNRRRLLRAGFGLELALLVAVVVTVAVLTDLRPPGQASAAPVVARSTRPPAPPPDAVVLAGQDDDVAVGLAASPRGHRVAIRVTTLGPDGLGIDGLRVAVSGVETAVCGSGCYAATVLLPAPPRRVEVSLSGRGRPATIPFVLPARWPAPSAAATVARASRVFRALNSLVIDERLASSARDVVVTTYRVRAPNRLAYKIVGGPEAVIVGGTRWDRDHPRGRWQRSETEPLTEPEPFWGSDPVRNARAIGAGRVGGRPVSIVSFFDPHLPAWFELWVDRQTTRLLALRMTAQAHFMRHRYSAFNAPLRIEPPR